MDARAKPDREAMDRNRTGYVRVSNPCSFGPFVPLLGARVVKCPGFPIIALPNSQPYGKPTCCIGWRDSGARFLQHFSVFTWPPFCSLEGRRRAACAENS